MKHQPKGGYKIVEYSQMPDGTSPKKRTLHKGLDMTIAELELYKLETDNK
jgi:hypothetical protein